MIIRRVIYAALAALLVLALAVGGAPRARAYTSYWGKVLDTKPANLIAFWPFSEVSGSTANDQSGNGLNGTYSGVTLNASLGPDAGSVPQWDGINDYANVYSGSLAAQFSGIKGSLLVWSKVRDASVWTDGTIRFVIYLFTDANNYIAIRRVSTNNLLYYYYVSGGSLKFYARTTSTIEWDCSVITWDASDKLKIYTNSTLSSEISTLGTWAGALSSASVGAVSSSVWDGYISSLAIWNDVLDLGDVEYLCDTSIPPTPTPTPTPSPTPDIYSYLELASGQGARVAFEVNVGEIALGLFVIILLGLVIFGPLFLNMIRR